MDRLPTRDGLVRRRRTNVLVRAAYSVAEFAGADEETRLLTVIVALAEQNKNLLDAEYQRVLREPAKSFVIPVRKV